MKKCILGIMVLTLIAAGAMAQAPVVDPGWSTFVVRASNTGSIPPVIQDPGAPYVDSIEFAITLGGQKAALGTDLINGALVSQISTLHVDRLDDVLASGSLYGPYFNIWVTDGLGNYAVIANEPSNAAWAADRWDVPNWAFLQTKVCKVYETPNAAAGTSWVHAYALLHGWSGVLSELTFDHVAGLTIAPPPPAYILNPANAVGTGAPDELGTNIARGFNWMFGDTSTNYISGGDGFVVDNYTATANFSVTNVTQGLGYGTIGAAMAAAAAGDDITVAEGTYNENVVIPVGVTLRALGAVANTTIAGAGGAAVTVNADNVEIYGFTITNPTGLQAIYANDRSGLHIHDNTITNVGDGVTAAGVQSIAVVCTAVDVNGVVIENNTISNIQGGPNKTMTAISIGWSTGSNLINGLVIQNNNISNLNANTDPWPVGHGAYGILLNHGTGTTGMTVAPQILNNTISGLDGLWSHGIGLEGNTPNAQVSGNVISNLIDHKSPSDAVAIFVEANASLGSVTITGNSFSAVNVGIANVVVGPDFVNAVNNNWGDVSGPYNPYQNPNGTGAAVYGAVTYAPWTGRTTSLVADLGIDPSSKTLGVDGYGYWEGTPALGLDDDFAAGFAPGAFQANVTAADPDKYTKYGMVPSAIFGRDIYVGELLSITYSTRKGTDHVVSPPDWFCQMYTNGTAHGWYGERINAEPYFSANLTETPGEWTEWGTDPGQNNRLRFFDSNLSLGSYTDGFLQDMANTPGYADQTIMLFGLATGTAWAEGFDGKLDGLTVELVSGETATFNFISGNALVAAAPATTGPLMCGQTTTLTFNLTTDQYTPDVFGFNAIVRASSEVSWGTIASLAPFGGTTQFFTSDNGDGSYDISGTTLGSPQQPISGAGTTGLFTIEFTTASEGVANITFDSMILRDPANAPIPTVADGATITIDCTAPVAVTGITAGPGHNKVDVSWNHADPGDVDHYEVYRGLWYDTAVGTSAYPEYDDVGAIAPTRPTGYGVFPGPAGEWVPVDGGTPIIATAYTDQDVTFTAGRGVYYYEVFAVDAAGNGSAPAAANDRATNYWLGDVATSGGALTPDGVVGVPDIDKLGLAFGTSDGDGSGNYQNYIDVGPTDDWSRLGIPTTDSNVDFEDLMIFSLNFGVVTSAKDKPAAITAADFAWVTYDDGSQALRLVKGTGLKGVRVRAAVPVGSIAAGQLLDDQSELTFLRNVGADLDANVAVMGVNTAFTGTGDLFIVRSGSGINVADLHITARDINNNELKFTMDEAGGTLTPRVYALNANYPNPFNPMTKISFSLPEAQDVTLAVYSLDGRRVATLVNETRGPGLHEIVWTGRDDQGQTVSSGMYFYRLDAGPYSQVRKMTLMK